MSDVSRYPHRSDISKGIFMRPWFLNCRSCMERHNAVPTTSFKNPHAAASCVQTYDFRRMKIYFDISALLKYLYRWYVSKLKTRKGLWQKKTLAKWNLDLSHILCENVSIFSAYIISEQIWLNYTKKNRGYLWDLSYTRKSFN